MPESATARLSRESSGTIPVSCIVHRGPRGFATLMVETRGGEVVLDAQVTGGCTIIPDEAGASALFDLLGAWLTGVEVGLNRTLPLGSPKPTATPRRRQPAPGRLGQTARDLLAGQ